MPNVHSHMLFGGATFSPRSLAPMAWYDFSDATTLFTDTGRTTPVASDGDLIKGVTDKSGLGHHLSEATNPPTYKPGIKNGKSIGRFDGTNDQLVGPTNDAHLAITGNLTIIFVGSDDSTATFHGMVAYQTGAATVNAYELRSNNGASDRGLVAFVDAAGGPQTPSTLKNYSRSEFNTIAFTRTAGVSGQAYVNGIDLGLSGTLTATPTTDASSKLTIGTRAGDTAVLYDGDISEVLIFNKVLTAAELDQVGAYVWTKWGVPWRPLSGAPQPNNHYDFSWRGTLWQDPGLTNPITADAQTISSVTDLSTNVRHLAANTAEPAYAVNVQNGLSSSKSDTASGGFYDAVIDATTTKTLFIVAKNWADPSPSFGNLVFIDGVAVRSYSGDSDPLKMSFSHIPSQVTFPNAPDSKTAALYVVRDNSASSTDLYTNGGTPYNGDTHPNWQTNSNVGIGGHGIGSTPNAHMLEVILYSVTLTAAQMNVIGTYLARKWGLTWTPVS